MIACYIRVSTTEQAENGHSIDEQTERTAKYCDAMGWKEHKPYIDAGFSGGNMERPALKQMIADAEAGKVERVVVYKLDRLSRSQLDTLFLIEKVFLAHGVAFVSMSESFDTSTAFGRATIGILAVFAQLEREQIKERMMMGKVARAKSGKYHGSASIPVGYDYIDGALIPNAEERKQVEYIFERFADGVSITKIALELNKAGLTHGGFQWYPPTIRDLLQRKTYIGYVCYAGKWYKGIHEPLISEELFERAQAAFSIHDENVRKYCRKGGKANSYLGGILTCAKCGRKYHRVLYHARDGSIVPKYYCELRSQKSINLRSLPQCKNKIWKAAEIESIVFGEIEKLALEKPEKPRKSTRAVSRSEAIRAELLATEKKVERIVDLYADGGIQRDALEKKMHALEEAREKLAAELTQAEKEEAEKASREKALPIARSFADVIENGTLEQARLVICSLIEKIELNDDDVKIFWKFE